MWIRRPIKLTKTLLSIQLLSRPFSQLPNYQYTLSGGKLSDAERKFYEQNGYIIIRKLIASSELEIYKKRFAEIANRKVKVPGLVVQKDVSFLNEPYSEKTVYKLQELFTDDVLFAYCRSRAVLDYVLNFTGSNVMAIHTMLINKPPDSGLKTTRHPLHQDLYYFPIRPVDRIVAVWTAMERVDRRNGCLVAWPGSHRDGLLEHGYPEWGQVNKAFHGILKLDKSKERVHLEMDAGDCIFFHPLLVHGSGANRSDRYRKAISCHYASSDCHYIDVRGTNQQVIADEIIQMAKNKYGIEVDDVADVWKFRAQLVQGSRINL